MRFPWVSRAAYDAKEFEVRQCHVWLSESRATAEHHRAEAAKVLGWYNDANDRLVAERTAMRADLDAERRRYDALLEKFTALKLAGGHDEIGDRIRAGQLTPKPEPDPVMQAIAQRMRGKRSAELLNHYRAYVAEQRAANVPDEQIAASILAGHDVDPATEGIPA